MDPNERDDEEDLDDEEDFENEDVDGYDPFTAGDFDYTSEYGDTCE